MKWNKFVGIFTDYPWLQMHLGSPGLVSLPLNVPAEEARRQLKEFVRTQLDYIAFRPFDQLDLSARNGDNYERVPHPKYRNVAFYRGESTDYTIRLHIEGPDRPFERARYVDATIQDAVGGLVRWHGEYWALRNCPLRLGAVVKCVSRGNDVTQFRRQHLEVYLFPSDFDLNQFKHQVAA